MYVVDFMQYWKYKLFWRVSFEGQVSSSHSFFFFFLRYSIFWVLFVHSPLLLTKPSGGAQPASSFPPRLPSFFLSILPSSLPLLYLRINQLPCMHLLSIYCILCLLLFCFVFYTKKLVSSPCHLDTYWPLTQCFWNLLVWSLHSTTLIKHLL